MSKEVYNPKNPDVFKQVELQPPTPPALNIVPLSDGTSTVKTGNFQSKNFRTGRSGYRLSEDGTLEARQGVFSGDVTIGSLIKTVNSPSEIQSAIDEVYDAGGGSVYLSPGTYNMSSDINLYSGINLIGSSSADTIIDFGTQAYSIKIIGTNDYETGTVTIANGSTTVTGNGTTWTSDMVGQYIFMGNFYYQIVTFTDVDEIEIDYPYDGDDLTNAYYKIATPIFYPKMENFTVQSSTSSAIKMQYCIYPFVNAISIYDSSYGWEATDCFSPTISGSGIECVGNAYGIYWTYCPGYTIQTSIFIGSTIGDGVHLENCNDATIFNCGMYSNTTNGLYMKDCNYTTIVSISTSNNITNGILFTSGCNDIQIVGLYSSNNGSDGIELTATDDRISISTSSFVTNGGYGINIAASTCDNNQIIAPAFDSNVSGDLNDQGTDTIVYGSVATLPVYKTYVFTKVGSVTSRFDITNPAGTTFRYTWDGTGTNPSITALTFPIGTQVNIKSNTMNAGNIGYFIVTGSGANYFEVTNASGVAENDKTLNDGFLHKNSDVVWTKPVGLKYISVELVGGGGGGGFNTTDGGESGAGGAGGYARKKILASSLSATETIAVGYAGHGGIVNFPDGTDGGTSSFGAYVSATGGAGVPQLTSDGGLGGVGSNGDVNTYGGDGGASRASSSYGIFSCGTGGASFFGGGGYGNFNTRANDGKAYGSGGGGTSSTGDDTLGGDGATGVIIIEEYF